jgi:zinc/manganese transport system ATP-binding protein
MSTDEPVISARAASVRLGGRVVWSDVDLRVGAGDFVAVLGPNGAGKSTLVKAILGVVPVASGELRVLGERPGQANDRIGYLPQRRDFDASVRIRGVDIVRLGLDGDRWGLPWPGRRSRQGRAATARIDEVVEQVGAARYAHRPIGELSGGEQQRLLIAQALVRRPDLLLLDEPLDSLDLPNQAATSALVSEICATGVAVMLVAHDVNPILPYLDRVVYLARGSAVEGTPDEVVTSDALSRLYGTAVDVLRTRDGRLVVVGQPEAPAHHHPRHP